VIGDAGPSLPALVKEGQAARCPCCGETGTRGLLKAGGPGRRVDHGGQPDDNHAGPSHDSYLLTGRPLNCGMMSGKTRVIGYMVEPTVEYIDMGLVRGGEVVNG
jgi:hypothetical protein